MSPWTMLGWVILAIVGAWFALNVLVVLVAVLNGSRYARNLLVLTLSAIIVWWLTRR